MATTNTTCATMAESFSWCPGSVELAGVRGTIYYIPNADIVKRAVLPVDSLGRPTSAELKGSYTTREGKTFKKLECLPNTNHYTSEAQGTIPSQTQLDKLDAIIPSTGKEATMIGACVNNVPCTFIFRDASGRARVMGNHPAAPAVATFAQDSGENIAGQVRSTLHVESSDLVAAPFYTGSIQTEDGEISFAEADVETA